MHCLIIDCYNTGGTFTFIHVSKTVAQSKAQGHFTKFKHISPQKLVFTKTCFDRTCSCSQSIKQYIPQIVSAYKVKSIFHLSIFFRKKSYDKDVVDVRTNRYRRCVPN